VQGASGKQFTAAHGHALARLTALRTAVQSRTRKQRHPGARSAPDPLAAGLA